MKIIDLLNKIANGEEVPKRIRIDHWCYKFEWVEHDSNYYDKHEDIDLMSCLSMDKEELNYEVHKIEEDKKIEKLEIVHNGSANAYALLNEYGTKCALTKHSKVMCNKINEIIDYLNKENK